MKKTRGGTDKLTDKAVEGFVQRRKAGTEAKAMLSDGKGLYLTLTPAGTPAWRVKYRIKDSDGCWKEKLFSPGIYPDVSLAEARKERAFVREQLRLGHDPMQVRLLDNAAKAVASDTTFAAVAQDWLKLRKKGWSEKHYLSSARAIERDVLPVLGKLPVDSITPAMVARCIEQIQARGVDETAERILWAVRGVFALAQTKPGSTMRENPALAARAVLLESKPKKPRAALLTFPELGDVLRRAEVAGISPAVRMCHRLIAFTASRIANATEAKWTEFDLDSDTPAWVIPRAQMKVTKNRPFDHKVLLGATIADELGRWKMATGGTGYVFKSPHRHDGEHITKESVEKMMRVTLALEGQHTVHGWRSSFATSAKEAGHPRDVVELALDHIGDTAIVRAYDRGQRLAERLKLMVWWDEQLSAAQRGGTVLSFRRKGTA